MVALRRIAAAASSTTNFDRRSVVRSPVRKGRDASTAVGRLFSARGERECVRDESVKRGTFEFPSLVWMPGNPKSSLREDDLNQSFSEFNMQPSNKIITFPFIRVKLLRHHFCSKIDLASHTTGRRNGQLLEHCPLFLSCRAAWSRHLTEC